MSPSRISLTATLFGVVVAIVGAVVIQGYEVSQAQAPVIVQLERVEIVGQREPVAVAVAALAQSRATR